MTPAEQRSEQLAALEKLRDLRAMADDAIGMLERVLTVTAATTPVLREPDLPWVSIGRAAQMLGVEKATLAQRARRGAKVGLSEKRGGRWYVRLDRMAPAGRGA